MEIVLANASLSITGSKRHELTLSASAPDPNQWLNINDLAGEPLTQISLASDPTHKRGEIRLQVEVPVGTEIRITQEKGNIYVKDFNGVLGIEAISASIRVEGFTGNLMANSRRGEVSVSASEGDIHAVAEADDIWFSDLHGNSSATNIMGNIYFKGMINAGDAARFETDHGSVNAELAEESSAVIQVTSAGGRIVCTLPGLSGMFDRCSGLLGDAAGTLTIRTVSGAIILNSTH